jgi:hypothetical protein
MNRTSAARPRTGVVLAVVVWEGQPRSDGDFTAQFRDEARARGIDVEEILTR